jgi:CHAD domain-containing protein
MRDYARLQTAILLRRFAFQVNRTSHSGDAESIHDLRVSIRRFSRCLRVFSQFYPNGTWRKLRSQLSELMSMAGAVRDRDIALELLADAKISERASAVTRLRAERERLVAELIEELRRWKSRDFSRKWRRRLGL